MGLDVRQKGALGVYVVIGEAATARQVRDITDSIIEACKAEGVRLLRAAGYEDGSWVVLDYASVIVHVFLPGERSYYDLESLWKAPAKAGRAAATNGSKKAPAKERARPQVKPTRPSRRRGRAA